MVWNRPEDLLLQWRPKRLLVGLLQILNEIVLLFLLEHGQLLVEGAVEL